MPNCKPQKACKLFDKIHEWKWDVNHKEFIERSFQMFLLSNAIAGQDGLDLVINKLVKCHSLVHFNNIETTLIQIQ
jgi:hypothetical protein